MVILINCVGTKIKIVFIYNVSNVCSILFSFANEVSQFFIEIDFINVQHNVIKYKYLYEIF